MMGATDAPTTAGLREHDWQKADRISKKSPTWGLGEMRKPQKGECQVLGGLEPANECPQWQKFVDYNEIKIYRKKR